jgi:hypothetical protein
VVFGALAVLAVVVIVTGLQLRHWYDASGIANCAAAGDCDTVTSAFTTHYSWLQTLLGNVLIDFFPAVIGVFWGAPLIARELAPVATGWSGLSPSPGPAGWPPNHHRGCREHRVGLLSWMVTWWSTPFDNMANNKFDPTIFSERDIAPLGYAAFAFALGVTAGLLIRRTLPAMATTLVGYIAARVVVLIWIRPHFQAPLHATGLLPAPGSDSGLVELPGATLAPQPGSWLVSSQILDPSGHPTNGRIEVRIGDPCVATHSCLTGYHQTITYQPASRCWPFQWYEMSLFIALAAILIGFCFWRSTAPFTTSHFARSRRPPSRPERPDASAHLDRATAARPSADGCPRRGRGPATPTRGETDGSSR